MIPVIVISLKRSVDRRAAMQSHLDEMNVPFDFFDGIDGSTMSQADRAALDIRPVVKKYGRGLTEGEIGLCAGYLQVLKTIADGPDPFVCVLEDDARLAPQAVQVMSKTFLSSLPPFDLMMLYGWPKKEKELLAVPISAVGELCVYAPYKCAGGTVGQIISKAGAAGLLRHLRPLRAPVDDLFYADPAFGCRLLVVRPQPIVSAGFPRIIRGRLVAEVAYRRVPARVAVKVLNGMFRRLRRFPSFVAAWGLVNLFRLRRFTWPTDGRSG